MSESVAGWLEIGTPVDAIVGGGGTPPPEYLIFGLWWAMMITRLRPGVAPTGYRS
jgi:hypothetical protein